MMIDSLVRVSRRDIEFVVKSEWVEGLLRLTIPTLTTLRERVEK